MSTVLHLHGAGIVDGFCGLVGRHPTMLALFDRIQRAGRGRFPVLIVGETGTGKELVAGALHQFSAARGVMVPVNVTVLSGQLADAELFGSVRGAFTGAVDRPGLIETAAGGTLFLDEAAELSHGLQTRLLRVLENATFRRLGSHHERVAHFRLVMGLQEPGETLVANGAWRRDFWFRVEGITLQLPPLRERVEDIPLLVQAIMRRLGRTAPVVGGVGALRTHQWPGNVRELIRVVERADFAAGDGPVTVRHLEAELESPAPVGSGACGSLDGSLDKAERDYIERVLREVGNTKAAADRLGVSSHQLYRKFKTLGIVPPRRR